MLVKQHVLIAAAVAAPWLGALHCVGGGSSIERDYKTECLYLWTFFVSVSFFAFLFAFAVGGLGLEFCVFVVGWRHAFVVSGLLLLLLLCVFPSFPSSPVFCRGWRFRVVRQP